MSRTIDMAAFRQRNRLNQQDIADFLGTSKSYISRVESGKSTLSDDSIRRLVQESGWDTAPLVPHFTRFCTVWDEYNRVRGENGTSYSPLENKNPLGIAPHIVEGLFYGSYGIDDTIANAIVRILPSISRDWLLTGEGPLFSDSHITNPEFEEIKKDLLSIHAALQGINDKLDLVATLLRDSKSLKK